jgi:hypothetical protein
MRISLRMPLLAIAFVAPFTVTVGNAQQSMERRDPYENGFVYAGCGASALDRAHGGQSRSSVMSPVTSTVPRNEDESILRIRPLRFHKIFGGAC